MITLKKEGNEEAPTLICVVVLVVRHKQFPPVSLGSLIPRNSQPQNQTFTPASPTIIRWGCYITPLKYFLWKRKRQGHNWPTSAFPYYWWCRFPSGAASLCRPYVTRWPDPVSEAILGPPRRAATPRQGRFGSGVRRHLLIRANTWSYRRYPIIT